MKLVEFRVEKFRNIVDSTGVQVDPQVTCLVGKNESGKTAVLQALERLNPARPKEFSILAHYPAWLEKRDRQAGEDLEAFAPITAVFELSQEDEKAVKQRFGAKTMRSSRVSVTRTYGGQVTYGFESEEKLAVAHALKGLKLRSSTATEAKTADTFERVEEIIGKLEDSDEPDQMEDAADLRGRTEEVVGKFPLRRAMVSMLSKRMPKFLYFGEYSQLPGIVPISHVLDGDPATLDEGQLTARSLLRLAAADDEYLMHPDYEVRKRELENVANALTHDVLGYWSQNPELSVHIDITQKTVHDANGRPQSVLDELRIRMYDSRHLLSLPFDERSTGFRWFFSFLAAFSEYEFEENPVVILLDEPALGLHARAQRDFLRFIEERLAPKRQVIYTTHSPFMVEPGRLERVRLVEDKGRDRGAVISRDVLSIDADTLFPLQGALGYDLAQHLFIGPHNLVVEGTSDFTYLVVISDYQKQHDDRPHLDDRWSIVPTGGADHIPTFVALLGMHLDMTVVVDAQKSGHQRLSALAHKGYLTHKRIVTIGAVLGRKEADVEDLFAAEDYLMLYNRAFGTAVAPEDIPGSDPIVRRLARHANVERFEHGVPADVLLRQRDELLPKLSEDTLARFGRLFEAVNATLEERFAGAD